VLRPLAEGTPVGLLADKADPAGLELGGETLEPLGCAREVGPA